MKVKELIELLQTLDQENNIWQMYDPPYDCREVTITHLVDDDTYLAKILEKYGVKEGDYAIVCG